MHIQRVAEDFSASAKAYDAHAFLQQQILRELASLAPQPLPNEVVLDAGSGTGMLADVWPQASLIGLDIAYGMCQQAQPKIPQMIVADMQSLPLASEAVAGVFSSLAFQWLPHPQMFLAEAHRVTERHGWLRLATLAPATLQELRDAYEAIGKVAPVINFTDVAWLQNTLQKTGWKVQHCEQKLLHTEHISVRALLHYLKALGARYKGKTQGGLRNQTELKALENAYPKIEKADNIQASWQVVFVKARRK